MISRRTFMRAAGATVAAAGATVAAAGCARGRRIGEDSAEGARRLRYVGWQVGVTYQSMQAGGLDRDHCMRLLDEMAAHRMNLLSLMMQSYGYFDPDHDGYAWPVQEAKLKGYRDAKAINAQREGEFVHDVIREAAHRDIAIQLFMNWGIWNPDFVRGAYPNAALQMNEAGVEAGWLHCPDSPGAWQLGLDESGDLLRFYDHPNVKSYAFERVSYSGPSSCYCAYTQEAFRGATGLDFAAADEQQREGWKTERICGHLTAFTAHLRKIRPRIRVALHTQCAPGWGHDPARLRACGIDYVLPHTIQFPTTQAELYAMLDGLAPNPCVLHFCTRDRRPKNYNLWLKTPAIIEEALGWIAAYPGQHIAGILFFNEPATSVTNKQAVYEGLRRHFA